MSLGTLISSKQTRFLCWRPLSWLENHSRRPLFCSYSLAALSVSTSSTPNRPSSRTRDSSISPGKIRGTRSVKRPSSAARSSDVGSAGQVSFLNFDTERPSEFVVIVFGNDLEKFPSRWRKCTKDKIVRVRGRVSLYRDKPEIVVTSPDQIEVLDALPETDSADPPQTARPLAVDGQLTVATYNALNMFDDEDDPYHGDEGTPAKPREELELLAQSIAELNADVMAFQEVENRFYLKRFVDVFLPEMGYDNTVHFEGNDGRGIDVCLVSRVPVGPVRSYRHLSFTGPDGACANSIAIFWPSPSSRQGPIRWKCGLCILKSNSGGREFAEPVRMAEANQLRKLLDEEMGADPEARILVLGDFNDTWESETVQTIVGAGSMAMWSATSELEGDLPDTYNTGQYQSMIDFILCSPAMAKTYVDGSFQVVPGSPETTGSDHNPVSVRFRLE